MVMLTEGWTHDVTLIYVVRDRIANEGAAAKGVCDCDCFARDNGWAWEDVLFLEMKTWAEEKGEEAWVLVPNADDRWLVDGMPYKRNEIGEANMRKKSSSIRTGGGITMRRTENRERGFQGQR